MEKAVGFYWTLPVTWAQFTDLPADVDAAAASSQTIRYQMEMIRHYAKDHAYQLIREEVFLEIEPDRGSVHIGEPLARIEPLCRKAQAAIMIVDFSVVKNWRRNGYMDDWLEQTDIEILRISPDPINTAAWSFDPEQHFRGWREQHSTWMAEKPEREARARQRASELKEQKLSYKRVVNQLNSEQLPSPTGKPWSESNLRSFLKKSPPENL